MTSYHRWGGTFRIELAVELGKPLDPATRGAILSELARCPGFEVPTTLDRSAM
jgi:hypothetical protein